MIKILGTSTAVLLILLIGLGYYALDLKEDLTTVKNNNTVLTTQLKTEKENVKKANEVSSEYQKQLSIVDNQLTDIRMRNKTTNCIVPTKPKRGLEDTPTTGIVSDGNGQSGLSVDWLYDFAGRCEKTRQKVIGLQNFYSEFNE